MKNYILLVLTCFTAASQVNAVTLRSETKSARETAQKNQTVKEESAVLLNNWVDSSVVEPKWLYVGQILKIIKNPNIEFTDTTSGINYTTGIFSNFNGSYKIDTIRTTKWLNGKYHTRVYVYKYNKTGSWEFLSLCVGFSLFWFLFLIFAFILEKPYNKYLLDQYKTYERFRKIPKYARTDVSMPLLILFIVGLMPLMGHEIYDAWVYLTTLVFIPVICTSIIYWERNITVKKMYKKLMIK